VTEQVVSLRELFPANVAHVRLKASVNSQMSLDLALAHKHLAALVAFELF